ncbi:MAG TPA: FMN-dependent NADH-azoreductase [Rudaea sp.]|nr:FMN-dependent NADH-azoreductase [Rudaea sp.]HSC10193.1 FMN-dependent NADH-azoreductase [Rhodanobacteraceae bacterium]
MKLLHIDSSILGAQSATRELGAAIVGNWQRQNPGAQVRYLDLAREPLSHLTGEVLGARSAPADQRNTELLRDVAAGERALEDFLAADVIVVGAPMYNFSIPSQLKAWIDRIAVAGKTFRYTEKGPEGLAKGKKIIIVSARGGIYSAGAPAAALDFQENYLRGVFGFLGITDIEFVRAEGLNYGPAQREQAMTAALNAIGGELPLAA